MGDSWEGLDPLFRTVCLTPAHWPFFLDKGTIHMLIEKNENTETLINIIINEIFE